MFELLVDTSEWYSSVCMGLSEDYTSVPGYFHFKVLFWRLMSRLMSRDVDVGCDRSAFVIGVVARNFSAAGKPRQPKFAYPRQRTIRAAGFLAQGQAPQ